MSQGTDPIAPTEHVLRRVHMSRCSQTSPARILRGGFCPSDDDDTGLSVYRELETTVAAVVAAARKPAEVYIARIQVQIILGMGLTLVREEDPEGPPGHHVIPELSITNYQSNRQALKDKQEALATIATAQIVHRPPPP